MDKLLVSCAEREKEFFANVKGINKSLFIGNIYESNLVFNLNQSLTELDLDINRLNRKYD